MNNYMKVIINGLKQWVNDTLTALDTKLTKRIETAENDMVKSVNNTLPDENGNVAIEISEGFSGSWNDLTDKPFYDPVKVELIDVNATLTENESGWISSEETITGTDYYLQMATLEPISFVEGETYSILINGTEYSDVFRYFEMEVGGNCYGFGDVKELTDAINDFKYAVMVPTTSEQMVIYYKYKSTEVPTECKIYKVEQEIKKLDEKYLPECVVKTVNNIAPDDTGNVAIEISEGFSGDYNDLTNKPTIPSLDGLATEAYADAAATAIKDDLLNGAGEAYDTLKELADLINENTDALDALEQVAAEKAEKVHLHEISDVVDLQKTLDEKADKEQLDSKATQSDINTALNRTNAVNAADINYTTYMARGESLNSSETNPTANGTIAWTYE